MSGTDKTKPRPDLAGPVVILVEPQLGENIGMAARAMGNFALTRLRIVNPRDGWPNVAAQRAAAGADHILEQVELFDTVEAAVADCTLLFATTARAHDQAKPVVGAGAGGAGDRRATSRPAGQAGILFGRERAGLLNEEVALADRIVTFPVNPGFASLNLAQAVLLMGYEWFKLATAGALPFAMPERSERASQHQMQAFFDNLVRELDKVEFLRPRGEARHHAGQPAQHLHPHGADQAGHAHAARRGHGDRGGAQGPGQGRRARRRTGHAPARAARRARRRARVASESGTVRGLARLLRRNPTDAERILWQALTPDRRFAGQFKRQTPVGRHIPDFVSFVHRLAIELVNAEETETIVADRAARQAWLEAAGLQGDQHDGPPMSKAISTLCSLACKRACQARPSSRVGKGA